MITLKGREGTHSKQKRKRQRHGGKQSAGFLLSCRCFIFSLRGFFAVVNGAVGRSAVKRRGVEVVLRKGLSCLGWGLQVLYLEILADMLYLTFAFFEINALKVESAQRCVISVTPWPYIAD